MTAFGDKNIHWIDIAMNDPVSVGGVKSIGDLNCEREKSPSVHRTPRDAVFQGQSIQKFHSDVGLPVLLANVINRTDIRMV